MAATEGHDIARSGASRRAAFTLVELLVVIAVITIFAGVIGFALFGGGGSTVGLQSSQSIIVGLLTQARSQAILTGRNAALLVNNNPANADRFRRYLVVVVNDGSGGWKPLDAGTHLPAGCYVLGNTVPLANAVDSGSWNEVTSSVLSTGPSIAIESTMDEPWLVLVFTPRGTTSNLSGGTPPSGNIVVSTGRVTPPGGIWPFEYTNVNGVRGVAVTTYGLTRLLDDRVDFAP